MLLLDETSLRKLGLPERTVMADDSGLLKRRQRSTLSNEECWARLPGEVGAGRRRALQKRQQGAKPGKTAPFGGKPALQAA
jgi:hypothetical protein